MQDCTAGHNKSCLKALPQWNCSWMSSVSVWRSGVESVGRDGLILFIRIQTNTLINFCILLFASVYLHLVSASTKSSSGRYIEGNMYSTRSSFVTLLSRRTHSGRWSSFGKRVWFTESHIVLIISFVLIILFTQFIVDKMKKVVLYQVKQLNHTFSK